MYRWFLALRYLLNRPINGLGVVGVTLGVWALIVVVSIFSGYIVEVRAHIRSTTADVSIFNLPPDCSFARARAIIERDPNVDRCAPRIAWGGLLHPTNTGTVPVRRANRELGEDSRFVHIIGIDPAAELEVSGLRSWLAAVDDPEMRVDPEQLFAATGALPYMLLSSRRAAVEGLRPGLGVRITCARLHAVQVQSVESETTDLVLQGAYTSKYVLFDASTAFVPIDVLRRLLGMTTPDACNVIAVKLHDPDQDRITADRLGRALSAALHHQVHVQDWEATNAMFLSAVDHQRSLMKLVLFVIMVVAAFLMFATLSMMVTEKIHDIGILSAMGATRRGVLQVFLSCGLAIAAAGTILGVGLGCVSSIYLDAFNTWLRSTFDIDLFPTTIYNLERVPYDLDPWWIMQVAGMAMSVGFLVSGLPAWRASRHHPVQSLRAE